MIRMLVVVQTAISLGAGEQVFLTGDAHELGRWQPDAVPLTRMDDNRWEVVLALRQAPATAAPAPAKWPPSRWPPGAFVLDPLHWCRLG